MAFANVKKIPFGGGISLLVADFTATAGAAAQTLAVEACRVLMAQVNPQVTGDPVDARGDLYSVSTTGGITTITVYTNAGISAGTFSALMDNGG